MVCLQFYQPVVFRINQRPSIGRRQRIVGLARVCAAWLWCIMADRGFEIQDLLVKSGLLLNIPLFKGAQAFLSRSDVVKTQIIASARSHVERAIGRVKRTFHIFDGDISLRMAGSINQIWSICALLTNFFAP